VLQRPGEIDLSELIQKYLGPAVVGFFLFVLPAIRAARAASKQREELKKRTLEGGAEAPGEASAGRKAWEDLLQGRDAAPPAPPPAPVPRSRVPPRVEPAEMVEEESLEDNPPPPLVELPSATATEPAAESSAEEFVATRERDEAARQVEVAAAEYEASSPYRAEVAPRPASAVPIVSRPAPAAQGAAERWLFPTEPARDRRTALRRAIVLREALGPPVALRGSYADRMPGAA
jgi:hypothetical protein